MGHSLPIAAPNEMTVSPQKAEVKRIVQIDGSFDYLVGAGEH
jgi:hypothetical protein